MHAFPRGTRTFRFLRTRTFRLLLVAAAAFLFSGPAAAVSIDYEVTQGAEPFFQFSFLHAATSNCCGAPAQYRNDGAKLFRIEGTLTADWDAGDETAELLADVTLSATVIHASVPNASIGDVFELVILAGSFLEDTPNGRAQGELDYRLFDPDDLVVPVAEGTFQVFPETSFPTSANRVSDSTFSVWANNWENGVDPVPSGDFFAALGIDMVAVPEAGTWLLLATAGVAALRRKRVRA